jgi:hypothetical protein
MPRSNTVPLGVIDEIWVLEHNSVIESLSQIILTAGSGLMVWKQSEFWECGVMSWKDGNFFIN